MTRPIANNPLFRPPAEADSLILQIDEGCPWNRCTFCGMYKSIKHRQRSLDEIASLIQREAACQPDATRVFLADGDIMRRTYDELRDILLMLQEHVPRLTRVSLYANGSSIMDKNPEQLTELKLLKLHTLYMGLESGDDAVLQTCRKGEPVATMIAAGQKAQRAGLRMSVMILLGLGGTDRSSEHAANTAQALNQMQPRLLSALRVIPVPGTYLQQQVAAGDFSMLTEHQIVRELRDMVSQLQLRKTVFRANHSSNIIPIEARLPQDQQRLLAMLDQLIASNALDQDTAGPLPMWL